MPFVAKAIFGLLTFMQAARFERSDLDKVSLGIIAFLHLSYKALHWCRHDIRREKNATDTLQFFEIL